MRVTTSLADIEFRIGQIERSPNELIVRSAQGSTLETTIRVTPRDARDTLRRLVTSRAFWTFLPKLLFAGGRRAAIPAADQWQSRRDSVGVNKPW